MAAWELLSDLKQKQRLHHEFPSGDFEFSFEESSFLNSFFPKDIAAKSLEFRPFGRNASGTIFALWNRTADLTIPVVGFGSEGERRVLSATLEDFLALLLVGYESVLGSDPFKAPAPTLITEEDPQARVKRFESGLAFYVDDRDNLDVEVSLDVISPLEAPSRLREFAPTYAAHTEHRPLSPQVLQLDFYSQIPS